MCVEALALSGVIFSEDNLATHTKGSKCTSAISRNHPWKIIRDAQTEVPIRVHCISVNWWIRLKGVEEVEIFSSLAYFPIQSGLWVPRRYLLKLGLA